MMQYERTTKRKKPGNLNGLPGFCWWTIQDLNL